MKAQFILWPYYDNGKAANYELYIFIVSAYLYGLFVYSVELLSACNVATIDNYMFTNLNTCK